MVTISDFTLAATTLGRFMLIDWSRIMLKLASIKEARIKNMMSINGMISIHLFFSGMESQVS